jgi:hypothetical protein
MSSLDVIYDLEHGNVKFNYGGREHTVSIDHLTHIQDPNQPEGRYIKVEVAGSDTVARHGAFDTTTGEYSGKVKVTDKKTTFARAKDKGESEGDSFRNTELFKERQARKRASEKNKDK